jgi:putative transposase
MYSYDDRMRAVKLYISLGKRMAPTLRLLGFGTKNSVKSWCREFEATEDLSLRRTRREKYSIEQKRSAIDHYVHHGRCLAQTVRALGYPCDAKLRQWVREAFPEERLQIAGGAHFQNHKVPHSEVFKQEAVVELCTRAGSATTIAESLAVSRTTLYKWRDQLLGRKAPATMKHDPTKTSMSSPPPERSELEKTVETLKSDIHKLQLEHDLLKKATELLKKGLGVDLRLLSNREKVVLVDALKSLYPIPALLIELDLPRSSYFYHRARLDAPDKYAQARRALAQVFASNHRCYGYRRLRAALGHEDMRLSEKVIRRLMKQEQLVAACAKRRRYGSYLGEISPAPENLLNRDFKAQAPNAKWLTDITEFHIPAGKVYLSPIIDCFDGMVISWTIGTRPDANLVNTMLDTAIETVSELPTKPIVHSDRGAHYRWPGWLERIGAANLVRSMSRKGCSPDNAACEGFFGRLKTELFYPRTWRETTIEQFINVVNDYIRWYNTSRIKMSLGAKSPIQYRQTLGLAA